MCKDFECIHCQNGICNYTDEECDSYKCDFVSNCSECTSRTFCFPRGEECIDDMLD